MTKPKNTPNKIKLEWGKVILPSTIGLTGVLATAICGCISAVLVAWITSLPNRTASPTINTPFVITSLPTSTPFVATPIVVTPTKDLPTITYQTLNFDVITSTNMDIYGKGIGDNYFGISPTTCWDIYMGNSSSPDLVAKPQNEVQMPYNFIVLSDQPIIISDISLYLDNYSPPTKQTSFTEGLYVTNRGGGEVTNFDLKNATIGKNFQRAILGDGKAYRIDKNDTMSFRTNLFFAEPGDYKLHIQLKIETYTGDSFAYTSESIQFSWLYLDDLTQIKMTAYIYGDKVTAVESSCK